MSALRLLPLAGLLLLQGCGLLLGDLPKDPPPLKDMEEPVELLEEPDDEDLRLKLPVGVFTGVYVEPVGESLDELTEESVGILVSRIVENSPGEEAGLERGDILLEVRVNDEPEATELSWPSQWRELELNAIPGDVFHLLYERAAVERQCALKTVRRIRPAGRRKAERYREEQKVGIVIRAATEVEARAAGFGPGGGAVVVGLSRQSPWRKAGLRFGDLLVEIDGRKVDHPLVVLDVIREADEDSEVEIVYLRDGHRQVTRARVSRRAGRVSHVMIPPLFSYESDRGVSETNILLGLVGWKSTEAAWEFKLLWFIRFRGGEADRLVEVKEQAEP